MVEEMSLSSSVYGWICNATWSMSGHTHPKPSVLLLELEPQSPEKVLDSLADPIVWNKQIEHRNIPKPLCI